MATLAAVDFEARGWNPQITTFGQPKVGNRAFTDYLTAVRFPLLAYDYCEVSIVMILQCFFYRIFLG